MDVWHVLVVFGVQVCLCIFCLFIYTECGEHAFVSRVACTPCVNSSSDRGGQYTIRVYRFIFDSQFSVHSTKEMLFGIKSYKSHSALRHSSPARTHSGRTGSIPHVAVGVHDGWVELPNRRPQDDVRAGREHKLQSYYAHALQSHYNRDGEALISNARCVYFGVLVRNFSGACQTWCTSALGILCCARPDAGINLFECACKRAPWSVALICADLCSKFARPN